MSWNQREFEILGLFASHPNEALPCDFFHNVIWPHPDMKHGIKEVIVQVESLKKKTSAGSIRRQLPDHRGKHAARTGVPI